MTPHCHTSYVKLQPLESATWPRTQLSRTETEAHLEAAQAKTGLRARLSATMMTGMATSQPRMACPSAAKPLPEKMSCRHTESLLTGVWASAVTGYWGSTCIGEQLPAGVSQLSAAWHARRVLG